MTLAYTCDVPETLAFVWLQRAGILPSAAVQVALIVAGAAAIAATAQLAFSIPFTAIPITGQNLGVLLVAAALGAWRGAAAVVAYLLAGAAGLPVFADGGAGLALLTGPRAGYFAGFIMAAAVVGAAAERYWDRNVALALIVTLLGQTLILIAGGGWLIRHLGFQGAVEQGVTPFFLAAWIKSAIAAALLWLAWRVTGPVEEA